MVSLKEGPLWVLARVRPLQNKGCDAHVDQKECSAVTSQQVMEVRKTESVMVRDISLIYIYVLRMQSSVRAQWVELGNEILRQVSRGSQFWYMGGPRGDPGPKATPDHRQHL